MEDESILPHVRVQAGAVTAQPANIDVRPDESISSELAVQIHRLQATGGRPMATSDRARAESVLGADFSHVRLHNTTGSTTLARRLGARAFTLGGNIFFDSSEYRPATRSGRALIAHELVHVLQASREGGGGSTVRRALRFDESVSNLSIGILHPSGEVTESSGMLKEFKRGLREYLGLFPTTDPENPNLITGVSIEQAQEKYVLDKIYALFDKIGGYVEMKDSRSSGLEKLARYSAQGLYAAWSRVRGIVADKLNSESALAMMDDAGQPNAIAVSPYDDQIHVNPDEYIKYLARRDTGWDGFWIVTHELLHTAGYKDARIGGIAGDDEKDLVKIPIADSDGAEMREVTRLWSKPGGPEQELNAIRIIFGLPLRYGYADDGKIRFSKLSKERSEPYVYDVTAQSSEREYYEYFGAATNFDKKLSLQSGDELQKVNIAARVEAELSSIRTGLLEAVSEGEFSRRPVEVRFSHDERLREYLRMEVRSQRQRARARSRKDAVRYLVSLGRSPTRIFVYSLEVGKGLVGEFEYDKKNRRYAGTLEGRSGWFRAKRDPPADPRSVPPAKPPTSH